MKINLVKVSSDGDSPPDGVILMSKGCQVIAEQKDYRIEVFAITLEGFRKVRRKLHTFHPKIDSFGGLLWKMDDKSELTIEMMARHLLKLICIQGEFSKN